MHVLGSIQVTADKPPPVSWTDQVVPPSLVRKITSPTAVQLALSTHEMAARRDVVPLVCGVHVAPPSAVPKIVPCSPTAVHVLTSAQEMPCTRGKPDWTI